MGGGRLGAAGHLLNRSGSLFASSFVFEVVDYWCDSLDELPGHVGDSIAKGVIKHPAPHVHPKVVSTIVLVLSYVYPREDSLGIAHITGELNISLPNVISLRPKVDTVGRSPIAPGATGIPEVIVPPTIGVCPSPSTGLVWPNRFRQLVDYQILDS